MRHLKSIAALGVAAAFLVLLFGCMFTTLRLTPPDSGTIQPISVGDCLEIRLPGNITTGHKWVRISPKSLDDCPLQIIREGDYDAVDSGLVGSPGHFAFEYRAIAQGTLVLELAYKRPLEESIDSFSVVVWVR